MPTDPLGLTSGAPLLDAWLRFQEQPSTPFTIPGHKQRHDLAGDVIAGDVPLYGGLDTIKLSRGLLADAEARAAQLWGADFCRFSTGGATHANQALALAIGGDGDQVVVSRTLHRSLLLGLVLAGLRPVWVRPAINPATGLPTGVPAPDVARALTENPHARAVFIGDPSYAGTVGDVAALAEVAHDHDVPLIVDAAWAAHFGFHPGLPPHALAAGADAMVISAHKTLPAWSQAALILARGQRLDPARLDAGVDATATTSPAGAILASIDAARALLERDGETRLDAAITATREARERLLDVEGLVVLAGPDVDPLKLTLLLHGTGASGIDVEQDLLSARIPVETAEQDLIVAVVSMADTQASLGALTDVLIASISRHRGAPRPLSGSAAYSVDPVTVLPPRPAFFADHEAVPVTSAVGRVSAELIAPYPPGIPVLAPGEQITAAVLAALSQARAAGLRIAYAADPTLSTLRVVSQGRSMIGASRVLPVTWVVFDLGEVLSASPVHLPELAALAGASDEAFTRAYWAHRSGFDAGAESIEQYWRQVLKAVDRRYDSVLAEQLTEIDDTAWAQLHPDSPALLHDVHASPARLGLLSNAPSSLAGVIRKQPWAGLFDVAVFSSDLGLTKPDPQIYAGAAKLYQTQPGQILFFDDRAVNVQAASEAGWQAQLWPGHAEARALLRQAGVL